MRGRKPKPTELKKLEGNPGHRPLTAVEPQLTPALPRCPEHLQGEARKEWRRVVRELAEAGLLSRVDRAALAAYCQTWARWVDAEQHLAGGELTFTTEKGYEGQSPWVGIANSALTLMHKFMVEFGMTPSSRARVKIEKPAEADPLTEFLRKKEPGK